MLKEEFSLSDVVRRSSRNLLADLKEEEIMEISHKLLRSENYLRFLREMEGYVFEKMKERN